MKTMILVASAATLALSAGSALAGGSAKGPTVASPKQPIPYSQLDSYNKASPKQRASKDWWSQSGATTGAAADTSATTSRTMPNDTPSSDATMPSGAVNPKPDDAATGAPPPPMDATAPKTDEAKGEMANPAVDKPR